MMANQKRQYSLSPLLTPQHQGQVQYQYGTQYQGPEPQDTWSFNRWKRSRSRSPTPIPIPIPTPIYAPPSTPEEVRRLVKPPPTPPRPNSAQHQTPPPPQDQQQSLSRTELLTRHRQLTRRITRDSLGSVISSTLALFMPWHLLSAGVNVSLLYRHAGQFSRLQSELEARGVRVPKRLLFQGLIEGAAVKLGTTVLLFGHDDLGVVANATDGWMDRAGDWIAEQIASGSGSGSGVAEGAGEAGAAVVDMPALQSAIDDMMPSLQGLVEDDALHRVDGEFISATSALASAPTDSAQEALGLATADDVAGAGTTGWHGAPDQIAQQVLAVGAVQLGTEKLLDTALEEPVDKKVDRVMRWRQQQVEELQRIEAERDRERANRD
ncbi:hypothetical protein F4778DRAFT_798201 [Xylariomycetidae sp. FL2044]|nr:hypothetical protein F4778DRAFT_798201 [Xylariomycetidae sp. FL2044]